MRDFLSEGDDDAVDSEIDLTPMLDVVFIMLIFFIVTASFVKEAGFDVNRPPQSNQPPKKDEIKNILVSIAADGQLFINRRPVDAGALTANIKRLHAENPQGSVVVQADRASTHKTLKVVLDAVQKAGVPQVAVAAEDET